MAVADEIAAEIGKVPMKSLDIDDDQLSFNGPVKTPATAQYAVPQDGDFGSGEFVAEAALTDMCADLIQHKNSLAHLKGMDVRVLWKRKGGVHAGKCSKATGLVRHLTDADFFIWLAADNCQGMSKHEIEALLFEQLCAAGRDENGNRVIKQPDVVTYVEVIRQYGLVTPALKVMGKAVRQLSLEGFE